MTSPLSVLTDLDQFDLLATRDITVNRIDPRAKVVVTAIFIVCVVSFERHTVSALLPFFIFPVALINWADIPLASLGRKIALALPFALLAGIFNPFLDHETIMIAGAVPVSAGWLSFCSILLRCLLTVSAALVLLATTGFHGICRALERLAAPRMLVLQMLFMYRYLFVLAGESSRMAMARGLRSFGKRGRGHGSAAAAIGCLLSRSIDRSRRIHEAMLARGFQGRFHERLQHRTTWADAAYVLAWCTLFVALRSYDLPALVGDLIGRWLA